jgi:hypothetical protein
MKDLQSVVGEARLNFYSRILPWGATSLAAITVICTVLAYAEGNEERALAYFVAALFLSILAVVAWDVATMIGRVRKEIAATPKE